MIGTPIQIAGLSGQALQGVVMKQEPEETGSSQELTITPVSLASHSQHVSVLQMGEVRFRCHRSLIILLQCDTGQM